MLDDLAVGLMGIHAAKAAANDDIRFLIDIKIDRAETFLAGAIGTVIAGLRPGDLAATDNDGHLKRIARAAIDLAAVRRGSVAATGIGIIRFAPLCLKLL